MKHVHTRFNSPQFRREVFYKVVKKQTELLEDYAQDELKKMIQSHTFKNQTHNLEDSYVWAVYFNGELRSHGFYGGAKASKPSYLHAWSRDNKIPVNGREEADRLVLSYQPSVQHGWEVIWAAAAPYSVYLDSMVAAKTRTNRFEVISQRFDAINHTFSGKGRVIFQVRTAL